MEVSLGEKKNVEVRYRMTQSLRYREHNYHKYLRNTTALSVFNVEPVKGHRYLPSSPFQDAGKIPGLYLSISPRGTTQTPYFQWTRMAYPP